MSNPRRPQGLPVGLLRQRQRALLAIAPNQVWSWYVTKLKGPAKETCFHLCLILDIFSRHVVGWLLAERQCAEPVEQLIADTVSRHDGKTLW